MRKAIRTIFTRAGQDSDAWPVVLLLFAVLVPAVCLLWFMAAAMHNERFAARQRLADVYRGQLSSSQARLERYWKDAAAQLEELGHASPASAAFAKCVQSGAVDGVIVLDKSGRVLYPNTATAFAKASNELESKWAEAGQLEYLRKDFMAAAQRYDGLAKEATNVSVAARALHAEARCLVQAGRKDDAIRVVNEVLSDERYRHAADAQGRLIVANAELMVLELVTDRASPIFEATLQRLKQRLLDYDNPALAAPQRRFLMKEVQRLSPGVEFPTLAAEELAAQFLISRANGESEKGFVLHRAPLPDFWQFTTPNHRILALVHSDKLLASMQRVLAADGLPRDAEIALLPPGVENDSAFVSLPAGSQLSGWRLTLSLKNQWLFDTAAGHQESIYLWSALLVIGAMGVLTLLAVRLLRRQTVLARLKNDLAATVSHELKTPLSSMRVLVDTLLDSEKIDEETAREYLQLIAQENERLSRLIQNFLTFSRMERKKYTFHFAPLSARQIIDAAVEAVRERFDTPGCRFEVQIEEGLPDVVADLDALATALINLLDNAYKYSEDIKHIVLRARAEHGNVIFSVRDNGIGIAMRETGKIFKPFHQVDQLLSRKGSGCGLGLSIVQFITTAHHGSVSVESALGRGSTFTLSVPAASAVAHFQKEAVA